ncbi:diguanylate cyclase [bacterium]|nr:diguanylate cyclase [bacterium]
MDRRKKITSLLEKNKAVNKLFLKSLRSMEDEKFYVESLNIFVDIETKYKEAYEDWGQILESYNLMKDKFDPPPSLSVVILHYFMDNKKMISHPFIMDYFSYNNLKKNAIHDFLTGVYNRAFFHQIMRIELDRAHRYRTFLTLVLVDLDDFKQINDTLGHPAGDAVLQQFADLLRNELRGADYLFRYGGDEFAMLLPETDINGALLLCERLTVSSKNKMKIGFSSGISSYKIDAFGEKELIEHADTALYQAKRNGKGDVVTFLKERRRFYRLGKTFEFLYRFQGVGDFVMSDGRNFSETGLLFSAALPINLDQLLDISFRLPNLDERISGHGKVVRIEKMGDSLFEIGIDFMDLIPDTARESIKEFISELKSEH